MATEPFRYQGKTIDQLSPDEIRAAREELQNQAAGFEALSKQHGVPQGGFPVPAGPGGGAALYDRYTVSPLQAELQKQREGQLAGIRRNQGLLDERMRTAEQERLRQEAAALIAGNNPSAAAGASPSVPLPSPYVPQGPEEAGSQGVEYKTVIASRRTPDGRIVFETQRVPVGDVPVDLDQLGPMPAAEEWRARALAENPQRAAATARFAGANPSGARSKGFQVGAGEGGFSPSRQIPLEKSWEEVFATESPLVQEKWLEAKRQGMELQTAQAPIEEAALRRRILTQQAARLEDPSIEVRERMLLGQQLLPQAQERRMREVDARVEEMAQLLRSTGRPPDETVMAALRMEAEKKVPSVDTFAQQLVDYYLSTDPGVNAASRRSSTYNIGG